MLSRRHMKKFLVLGILVIALFLVIGAGCSKQKDEKKESETNVQGESGKDGNQETINNLQEGRLLVDRVRYVQANNPPFDFTNVIFHQKSGAGYRAEISSDKNLKVEVMNDKDCLFKGEGKEYKIISEDEGTNIVILGDKNEGNNRNLCIGATATGNSGQIEIQFKVVELI